MACIISQMTAEPSRFGGIRYEGQLCEANNITPDQGDEFFAWDIGYTLRERDSNWTVDHRGLPVPQRALDASATESF